MAAIDLAPLEQRLKQLAWRAEVPNLVLGVLLLVLGVGVIFLGFALLIHVRSRQLVAALRAQPPRVATLQLQTRRAAPMGIDAFATVFAVIGFALPGGAPRTLRLQGRAGDLAEFARALEAACPAMRVDDPQTVRVLFV